MRAVAKERQIRMTVGVDEARANELLPRVYSTARSCLGEIADRGHPIAANVQVRGHPSCSCSINDCATGDQQIERVGQASVVTG